jgi:hypothetical protein
MFPVRLFRRKKLSLALLEKAMSGLKVSEFMLQLAQDLTSKKQLSENTAAAYVRGLFTLNGKVPYKNLAFLKNTDEIDKKIAEYAPNTQKSLYSAIVSVLNMYESKYKKALAHYTEKMNGKAKEAKEVDTSEKTDKEKENWVSWDDVMEKKNELKSKIEGFKKQITPAQWEHLLQYTILSLYTDIQPRRNQDYLDMYVVRTKKGTSVDALEKDKNYLVLDGSIPRQFIFNKFKTAKTYGQQQINIPPPLAEVLQTYLRHHPSNVGNKKSTPMFKFLVLADGTPMTAVNAITRALNKVFGKKVGSSMLRHIFLSSKYDVEEMKEDAAAMGHSISEQRAYLKKDE